MSANENEFDKNRYKSRLQVSAPHVITDVALLV